MVLLVCHATTRFLSHLSERCRPCFIQALEHEDLAHPGTVAHLKLKLGGRAEAPSRVVLGA